MDTPRSFNATKDGQRYWAKTRALARQDAMAGTEDGRGIVKPHRKPSAIPSAVGGIYIASGPPASRISGRSLAMMRARGMRGFPPRVIRTHHTGRGK